MILYFLDFFRKQQKEDDFTFTQCTEYLKENIIDRARMFFARNRRQIMLYTERYQFFNEPTIRGIKKILFYSLPTFPGHYPRMLNMLNDTGICLVLFSKYDIYQLQPLLGDKRCAKLLSSNKKNHLFV